MDHAPHTFMAKYRVRLTDGSYVASFVRHHVPGIRQYTMVSSTVNKEAAPKLSYHMARTVATVNDGRVVTA